MRILRRKRLIDAEEEALDKMIDSKGIRKIDRIYIITACVFVFAWIIWNFTALKNIKIYSTAVNYVSDTYSNWQEERGQSFVKTDEAGGNIVSIDKDYIYYYEPSISSIYRMKRDGTGAQRVVKDTGSQFQVSEGIIYYIDMEGKLKKEVPGEEPQTLIDSDSVEWLLKDGNYIYVGIQNGEEQIHRVDIEGKNDTMVFEGVSTEMVPYGNYLYYLNFSGISRTKNSGSDYKTLLQAKLDSSYHNLGIYHGFIYFLNNQELYRCSLDGSKLIKLKDGIFDYTIDSGLLYYTQSSSDGTTSSTAPLYRLYSASLNGQNSSLLDEEKQEIHYIRDGVLATMDSQYKKIYKDITSKRVISMPEPELAFAVDNISEKIGPEVADRISGTDNNSKIIRNKDGIYYLNRHGSGVYKASEGNEDDVNISDVNISSLDGMGNLLFFKKDSYSDNRLYCMNTDGTGIQEVFDFPIDKYTVQRDGIYFTLPYGTGSLYKAEFSDGKITKVSSEISQDFLISGNYVYYASYGEMTEGNQVGSLYRIKMNGTSKEKVLDIYPEKFSINNGYIYYLGMDYNYMGILKRKLGENKSTLVIKTAGTNFFVTDKYIYYTDDTNGETLRCNLQGGDIIVVDDGQNPVFADSDNMYIETYFRLETIKP